MKCIHLIIILIIVIGLIYINKYGIEGYKGWPYDSGLWPYWGLHPYKYLPLPWYFYPSYGFYSAEGKFYYTR